MLIQYILLLSVFLLIDNFPFGNLDLFNFFFLMSCPEISCHLPLTFSKIFFSNYENLYNQQSYTTNIPRYRYSGRSDDEEYLYPQPSMDEQSPVYSDCGPFSDIDEPDWNPDYVNYRHSGDYLPWADEHQIRLILFTMFHSDQYNLV